MSEDIQQDLDLLALAAGDDSLSLEKKAELEAAIAKSEALAARYAATQAVVEFVDQLPIQEPSLQFAARLERRLDAIDARAKRPWWTRWQSWPEAAPRWAAAAAVAAAGAGAVFVWPSPEREPVPAVVAQVELLEDLELWRDFDVIEQLDVLEDLEVIEELEGQEPG